MRRNSDILVFPPRMHCSSIKKFTRRDVKTFSSKNPSLFGSISVPFGYFLCESLWLKSIENSSTLMHLYPSKFMRLYKILCQINSFIHLLIVYPFQSCWNERIGFLIWDELSSWGITAQSSLKEVPMSKSENLSFFLGYTKVKLFDWIWQEEVLIHTPSFSAHLPETLEKGHNSKVKPWLFLSSRSDLEWNFALLHFPSQREMNAGKIAVSVSFCCLKACEVMRFVVLRKLPKPFALRFFPSLEMTF